MESGHYFNKFSLNIFGGISAGNYHLEIGGVSNVSTQSSTGLQIAGLANVVGSNTYLNISKGEELALVEDGFSVDMKGIQLAGMLNYVRNNSEGIQLTGGVNFNNGYMHGFQLAGLANMAGKQAFGVQIAGLYNVALRGMTGSQLSVLFNYTYGQLSGLQLGLINRAVMMNGKNSLRPSNDRGFQLGLINIASEMDGTQIGLINFAGKSHGVQIGLINFFKPGPYRGSSTGSYGAPVGLLNIGSNGSHIRVYADELFLTTIERTTGNCQNCTFTPSQMPFSGRFKVMNQNALIFAYNHWQQYNAEVKWGIGYGFTKVYYNKSSMIGGDTRNGRFMLSWGLRAMHLNRTEKFDKQLSLLTRAHIEAGFGSRWALRTLMQMLQGSMSGKPDIRGKRGPLLFGGVSLNNYLHTGEDLRRNFEIAPNKEQGLNLQYWPGYSFGIQF